MSTLTIRLSDEVKDDLRRLSEEQCRSVREIVTEAIRRYVAVERFRSLHRMTLLFAEAQGYLTDTSIFDAIS